MLDRVERLAAPADDSAHVCTGQVYVHTAVFSLRDLDLRFCTHAFQKPAQKAPNFFVLVFLDLILDADDSIAGADSEKAGFCALHDFHGNLIAVETQFLQSGGNRLFLSLGGLFQYF